MKAEEYLGRLVEYCHLKVICLLRVVETGSSNENKIKKTRLQERKTADVWQKVLRWCLMWWGKLLFNNSDAGVDGANDGGDVENDDGDSDDNDDQGKPGAVRRTSCWTNPGSALLWRGKRSEDVRLITLVLHQKHCINCKCRWHGDWHGFIIGCEVNNSELCKLCAIFSHNLSFQLC